RADAHPSLLQLERGDERDQVRVAAPLAEPVRRALHLHAPPLERLERVRDRQLGVVVTVDAEAGSRDGTLRRVDGPTDLRRQRPAPRVAEAHERGALT